MQDLLQRPDNLSGFYHSFLDTLSTLSLISAILVVTVKNPIVSVLFLISLFLQIAVYLIFIGLNFLGLSYLLVYVGAVSILFLFILMLINIRVSELSEDTNNNIPLAILAILTFFIPLSDILPSLEKKTAFFFLLEFFKERNIKYVSSSN